MWRDSANDRMITFRAQGTRAQRHGRRAPAAAHAARLDAVLEPADRDLPVRAERTRASRWWSGTTGPIATAGWIRRIPTGQAGGFRRTLPQRRAAGDLHPVGAGRPVDAATPARRARSRSGRRTGTASMRRDARFDSCATRGDGSPGSACSPDGRSTSGSGSSITENHHDEAWDARGRRVRGLLRAATSRWCLTGEIVEVLDQQREATTAALLASTDRGPGRSSLRAGQVEHQGS